MRPGLIICPLLTQEPTAYKHIKVDISEACIKRTWINLVLCLDKLNPVFCVMIKVANTTLCNVTL